MAGRTTWRSYDEWKILKREIIIDSLNTRPNFMIDTYMEIFKNKMVVRMVTRCPFFER